MILNTVINQIVDYAGCFFDKRLEKRGEEIVKKMIEKETAVLNQLSNNRAELVGASRFFSNDSVTEDALIKESAARCKNAAVGRHLLAIQDTSEVNYESHRGKLSIQDPNLGLKVITRTLDFFFIQCWCWIEKMLFR